MTNLRLTFACGPTTALQACRDGTIRPEGMELNYLTLQPAEIFWRMLQFKEFDASEMSLSNYTTLVSGGDAPFVAIPVFPSRGVPPRLLLHQHHEGHREALRPQGQAAACRNTA